MFKFFLIASKVWRFLAFDLILFLSSPNASVKSTGGNATWHRLWNSQQFPTILLSATGRRRWVEGQAARAILLLFFSSMQSIFYFSLQRQYSTRFVGNKLKINQKATNKNPCSVWRSFDDKKHSLCFSLCCRSVTD